MLAHLAVQLAAQRRDERLAADSLRGVGSVPVDSGRAKGLGGRLVRHSAASVLPDAATRCWFCDDSTSANEQFRNRNTTAAAAASGGQCRCRPGLLQKATPASAAIKPCALANQCVPTQPCSLFNSTPRAGRLQGWVCEAVHSRSPGCWQHAGLSQQLMPYTCVQEEQRAGKCAEPGLAWGTQIEHATKEKKGLTWRDGKTTGSQCASRQVVTGRKNEAQREVKT